MHVRLRAGLLPCSDDLYGAGRRGGGDARLAGSAFSSVFHHVSGAAFVGVVDYRVL